LLIDRIGLEMKTSIRLLELLEKTPIGGILSSTPSTIEEVEAIKAKRSCGPCYTCCVAVGINELKKWPYQACKHLDGRNPEARCSIYERRPTACQTYLCAWRQGIIVDENARPHESGILISMYPGESEMSVSITIVLDSEYDPDILLSVLSQCVAFYGTGSVRIIERSGDLVEFKDGCVRVGKTRKAGPGEYESLVYGLVGKPIATYHSKDVK
jgi:hypothetical protein